MTVWTDVSLAELNAWLEPRGFNQARAITPIEEGVEDSVFRVDHVTGEKTCLRLFERTEPNGPLSIATRLAACGLLCNPPLLGKRKNRALVALNGKPAALFPWIDGAWTPTPSLEQIKLIGAFLGQMGFSCHPHCDDWVRKNPRDWDWFQEAAQHILPHIPHEEGALIQEELAFQLSFWSTDEAKKLPHGPVHADLFRDNVMFKVDGSLGAVIDWGFCASNTPLIYDLAIVANDWCLKDDACSLDEEKLAALFSGRGSIQPLSDKEKEAWPMALRWAALRFYLSRALDLYLPREPDGRAHDPKPFLEILKNRQHL